MAGGWFGVTAQKPCQGEGFCGVLGAKAVPSDCGAEKRFGFSEAKGVPSDWRLVWRDGAKAVP
ncbi:MAG: hypothetical protein RR973_06715, partial [Anaerovoracaceae bacterium]